MGKISQYDKLDVLGSSDLIPVVNVADKSQSQDGTTKYITGQEVLNQGGQWLNSRTTEEIAAGVTPTNYEYQVGNVKRYGATGDGATDDRAAILLAISVAAQSGGTVYFPAGTYVVSKYLYVNADNITFLGDGGGSIISYPSADATVVADAYAYSDGIARSAFYVKDADNITFRGLSFLGQLGDTPDQAGTGIKFSNSQDAHVVDCRADQGCGLISQDADTNDLGLKVDNCEIYNFRSAQTLGNESIMSNCRLEQPDSTDYDVGGTYSSSHGIYMFGGRQKITVTGCIFKNIRTDGVKISGTTGDVHSIIVQGNKFIECARGVDFGMDTAADDPHTSVSIVGNQFIDCGTNRQNWSQQNSITSLGGRNIDISHNQFYYTRVSLYNVAAHAIISCAPYGLDRPPVINLKISNNQFFSEEGLTTSQVATYAIRVTNIGHTAEDYGAVQITDNQIMRSAGQGITVAGCINPRIEGNDISGCVTSIFLNGNRMPAVVNNNIQETASSNAQLRLNFDSFPIVYNNRSMGRTSTANSQSLTVSDGNAGSTHVDFPLLGTHGRAVPTGGKPEIVFGFGYNWVDGDTITVAGTVCTYRDSTPGANEFTTVAELIALIDAISGLTCVDYGATWSIDTNHLLVQGAAAAADFQITKSTTYETAGVLLMNGTGGTLDLCVSRGSGAADTETNVWSPMIQGHSVVTLMAENAAAATQLQANGYYESNKLITDAGCVLSLEHGTVVGSPQFRWAIH